MADEWVNVALSSDITDHEAAADPHSQYALESGLTVFLKHDGSVTPTVDFPFGSFKITSLGTPTADADAATKAYVDAAATAVGVPRVVRLLTFTSPSGSRSGNVFTFGAAGSQSVDSVVTALGDRILMKDGPSGSDNGVYTVTTKGTGAIAEVWTRATSEDSSAEVLAGMFYFVTEGTNYADSLWLLTTDNPITLNTTTLTFARVDTAKDTGWTALTGGAGGIKGGLDVTTMTHGELCRVVQALVDALLAKSLPRA